MRTLLLVAVIAALFGLPGCGGVEAGEGGAALMPETAQTPQNAPEFIGGPGDWVNSEPLKMAGLRGKVVLIDFWEYTCVNCIRTFPYVKEWHARYKDKGLVVVGIHTPEFRFAKDGTNVRAAIKRFGLEYPTLLDPDYENWRAYANRYWPRKYLIDKDGKIVYDHIGEGGYGETEAKIQELLRQIDPDVSLPALMEPVRGSDKPGAVCYPVTPEIYAGSRGFRAGQFGQSKEYKLGDTVRFQEPSGELTDGSIYLAGTWDLADESVRFTGKDRGYLVLKYHAKECNAVFRSDSGKPFTFTVTQDGRPLAKKDAGHDVRFDGERSYVRVDHPGMYSLTVNRQHGEHVIRLIPDSSDFRLYSFTFSSCEVPGESE